MIDLLLILFGRCPWCTPRESPWRDWLADHLPYRMYAGLKVGKWDYNSWVGKTAHRFHSKHGLEVPTIGN